MERVYVGLSGGVDSSVAAALLKRQGYDVTGVYMKNWSQDLGGHSCPWREDLADARAVAAHLDIPFKVYDFEQQYFDKVVQLMVREYTDGRTPNPDVVCNQEIKFKLFLETALADGADAVASGHYAAVEDGRLMRSADCEKDQTYFLYRLSRVALGRTIFPLGALTKPEVRARAAKMGLPTAAKKDSQGICFIGEIGMKQFLSRYVKAEPGPIVLRHEVIGEHDGAIFYTIGQRQGLGVGGGRPFYVLGKDMAKNIVYVTDDPNDLELRSDSVELESVHWLGAAPQENQDYQVRLRHRGELIGCRVDLSSSGVRIELRLDRPAKALAAGQSAVLYDDRCVIGGGVIKAAALTRLLNQPA